MTRFRAGIILIAFAFAMIAAPLLASNGMCKMACCKHGKNTAMQSPMCPLPAQCPEVSRNLEETSQVNAVPVPAQPVVHAVPVVVAVVASPPPPRRAASDEIPFPSSTHERPVYLFDSVFLI